MFRSQPVTATELRKLSEKARAAQIRAQEKLDADQINRAKEDVKIARKKLRKQAELMETTATIGRLTEYDRLSIAIPNNYLERIRIYHGGVRIETDDSAAALQELRTIDATALIGPWRTFRDELARGGIALTLQLERDDISELYTSGVIWRIVASW